MNPLLHLLASDDWATLVAALLHTLWLGALVAAGLWLGLRRQMDPLQRYRWCVAALLGVVLGGIIAWAILQQRPAPFHPTATAAATTLASPANHAVAPHPEIPATHPPLPIVSSERWTSCLALLWLGGVAVMLARAGSLVMKAEQLRRRSRPLTNEAVLKLVAETRRQLGLARRLQVLVTDRLISPAVMGWLTPVLILPLSMVTTLPPEQLQLILLHELAHIRRRDYLVNLCQLLAESLLFFNPAVWWLSRQIRQEREACCDAIAIALAGERVAYARTLAQVAGETLAAAPAFADQRHPSGLKDRIQRLLVPGYRPALRLTWHALLLTFLAGGGLLFLSALGVQVAVAAILTPQERIDRIEKKMAELGDPVGTSKARENHEKVSISAHFRTADGSPLPNQRNITIHTVNRQPSSFGAFRSSSVSTALIKKDGTLTDNVSPSQIWIVAEFAGYAPTVLGPLNGLATNRIDAGECILNQGFTVSLQVTDADTGAALAHVPLHTQFFQRESGVYFQGSHDVSSDAAGRAALSQCLNEPLIVTVNMPGYELTEHRFDPLSAGQMLEIILRPGAAISGRVVDKATGQGIPNALLQLLREQTRSGSSHYEWTDPLRILGRTDADGQFSLHQFRRGQTYWLGVSAPGHESAVLETVAGAKAQTVKLGDELIVHGHVLGQLAGLQQIDRHFTIYRSAPEMLGNDSRDDGGWVPLDVKNGMVTFQFTNRIAGLVTLAGKNYSEQRDVTTPIADWVVNLDTPPKAEPKVVPTREVIFRFQHPSGVSPRGTVTVNLPENLDPKNLTARDVELEITNGEVRAAVAIGGRTSVEPRRMVGFWFDRAGQDNSRFSILVTSGVGPQIIEIPLVPAGAIYALARETDGAPAGGVLFGVIELKRAPGRTDSGPLDNGFGGFSDYSPRSWISGPLPLGGTYQVHSWRGNSFCLSQPLTLTEEKPDAEIELQFPPGKTFTGIVLDPAGKPLADAELPVFFNLSKDNTFGLKSVFTDGRGRFQIEAATPKYGDYSVSVSTPGAMTENVKLDFNAQPQSIRLQRGHLLAGRVVEAGTGYPIPGVTVSAVDLDRFQFPQLNTTTDAAGHFEFTALGDANYHFFIGEGQSPDNKKFRANGATNLVLPVKLYPWSKAKPRPPQ